MSYRFSVEHIAGDDNVVADMLSRWRILYPHTVCGANFQPGICSAMHKKDFIWPTLDEIGRLQGRLTQIEVTSMKLTPKIIKDHTIYVTKSGRIYIPDSDMRVRLCVIAHAGSVGHRGIQPTYKSLKRYYWPHMLPDVKKFCRQCLHCAVADPRKVIPRPLGTQMHASKPNEILHYDFIHIGPSKKGLVYMLTIKDDFTGYVNFYPCTSPTSEVVVESLLSWYSLFGVAVCHVSDQGSHFKNEVVRELNRRMTTKHHFTLPYAPWINGTIERVNREIRRLIRVWNTEFRTTMDNWPNLLPLMVHVLNFSVSSRTGYPPAYLFGRFSSKQPLDTILTDNVLKAAKLPWSDLTKHVIELGKALDSLHKEVAEQQPSRGHYSIPRNTATFDKGDFVMYATRHNESGPSRRSKPCWTGPYRVIECLSDWDFRIQHLVTNDIFHAHSSRLKYYCDSDLNVTPDLKYQIAHDEMRYKVANFLQHKMEDGVLKLLTQWQGFDVEDATWEPIGIMTEDVPSVVQTYILALDAADPLKPAMLASIN